jgi:hypothetical protein
VPLVVSVIWSRLASVESFARVLFQKIVGSISMLLLGDEFFLTPTTRAHSLGAVIERSCRTNYSLQRFRLERSMGA